MKKKRKPSKQQGRAAECAFCFGVARTRRDGRKCCPDCLRLSDTKAAFALEEAIKIRREG